VTDATYWSDSLGEGRQTAPIVAVNHARAQILAPHRVVDPWAGLDGTATSVPDESEWPTQDSAPSPGNRDLF
jgi:hypothetical protein